MGRRRAAALPALLATLLLVGVGGCDIVGPEADDRGTVRFLQLEGGCWVLETASETVQPINLPEAFQVDGLAVRFEAEPRPDLAGFCPGRLIELESIERIS